MAGQRTSQKKSKTIAAKAKSAAKPSVKSRAKAQTKSGFESLIAKDIWPTERQILFKPERLRYVRKIIKPDGCVFCSAIEKGVSAESLLLYQGKHAMIVMNKFPYNTGHMLILPRRHCGAFLELTKDEHREINECLQKLIGALTEVYQPAGFNVGLNLGSAAGAGIPEHLHYHVIPRWNGDTNFFPLIAETKVVVETLEQTFERLISYFKA